MKIMIEGKGIFMNKDKSNIDIDGNGKLLYDISEREMRFIIENASDVIWTMNLQGEFIYISPSAMELRGYTVDEIHNQSINEIVCKGSEAVMHDALKRFNKQVSNNEKITVFRADIEKPCKDGRTVWCDTTVSGIYDENNKFISLVGISRDITERKKMEEQIERLSMTDHLTQIYNRGKLSKCLYMELEHFNRSGKISSVVIIDIDNFKQINDRHGHPIGDLALVEFTEILKNNIRAIDILGRWGGEEFMIILPGTDIYGAEKMAEKLRNSINNQKFSIVDKISASFGITMIQKYDNETDVISRADQALYKAKENGRNRVEMSIMVTKDGIVERL